MIRIASLRFAFSGSLALLLLLMGCSAQPPAWERYRTDPPAAAPESAAGAAEQPSFVSGHSLQAPVQAPPAARAPDPNRATPGLSGGSRVLPPNSPFSDPEVLRPYLRGTASWYGPGFHGEATASGEIYNQYGLTAAHPMLPLGTKVEVENLKNGRKVWLRINDRGPYKKGRILDLSKLAAENLGIVDDGTAPVQIRVLRWPDTIDPRLGLKAYTEFVVQVVSRPDPLDSEMRRRDFQARFPWLHFRIDRPPGGQYTVIAGPYDDERAARAAALRLQHEGVTCLVRSYRK